MREAGSRGTNAIGELQLEKSGNYVSANTPDTIFHVFSEDFVHEELREKSYKIDGEIENQISVDSGDIKLKDVQEALGKALGDEQTAKATLLSNYNKTKLSELSEKADVNKQLKEYKALDLDALLNNFSEKPNAPEQAFVEILKDLDSLKSIPAEPSYPDPLNFVRSDDVNLETLDASLQRVTSPSSVIP